MEENKINDKQLQQILNEYINAITKAAEEIINEFKNKSQNYKELDEKLISFRKQVEYKSVNHKKFECLFERISELIEEEKNDLPLTNRSHP